MRHEHCDYIDKVSNISENIYESYKILNVNIYFALYS